MEIITEKKIHRIWQEYQDILNDDKISKKDKKIIEKITTLGLGVGKWQYIYKSNRGAISLISLYDIAKRKKHWEIYEISDKKLFDDVKRFETKEKAVKKIRSYLK